MKSSLTTLDTSKLQSNTSSWSSSKGSDHMEMVWLSCSRLSNTASQVGQDQVISIRLSPNLWLQRGRSTYGLAGCFVPFIPYPIRLSHGQMQRNDGALPIESEPGHHSPIAWASWMVLSSLLTCDHLFKAVTTSRTRSAMQ